MWHSVRACGELWLVLGCDLGSGKSTQYRTYAKGVDMLRDGRGAGLV